MPVYGLLSPQNANASGSIFDAPQPAPGLLSPPPPQSPDAALAVMNAAIRDAGAAMQRRRDSENAGRPAGSLLNMLPPASANSNGSLPDWFGTMPEFAKRNYLLSLADSVSNQSSGVVQPLTSFLLGLMGAAS